MEILAYIILIPSLILLVVSVWRCYYFLYFKKGNIKKSLLLLFISIILTFSAISLGVIGEASASPIAPISAECINVLETKDYKEASNAERQLIIGLARRRLTPEDRAKYGEKIKNYYVRFYVEATRVSEEQALEYYKEDIKKYK